MIEEIKAIGSFVGLATGIFFFYDRLVKGRPIASLTISHNGTRKLACIRISNPSAYDIAITDATVRPSTYFLTEDLETRSLVEGAAGHRPYFMLRPGEAKELVIAPNYKDNLALEVRPHRVSFWVWWRRGNATWLPQLPVWVLTSTPTIRKYGLERS